MPPLNKPPKQAINSPDNHPHKNYDPVNWDQYFDELFYLDDVQHMQIVREHLFSELAQKEPYFSASMALDSPLKALLLSLKKSNTLGHS